MFGGSPGQDSPRLEGTWLVDPSRHPISFPAILERVLGLANGRFDGTRCLVDRTFDLKSLAADQPADGLLDLALVFFWAAPLIRFLSMAVDSLFQSLFQ